MIVLQILGVIFLLLLLVLAFIGFRFWRGLRSLLRRSDRDFIKLLNILPPINLQLLSLSDSEWQHPAELKQDSALLSRLGFNDHGLYQCELGDVEAHLSIWSHPLKNLVTVIYEVINHADDTSKPFIYYDIMVKTPEGAVSVSTSPIQSPLPVSADFRVVQSDATHLKTLFSELKSLLPAGVKIQPIGDGQQFYLDVSRKYNQWLWQKEQLDSPEMHRIYDQLNITLSDELMSALLDHARHETNESLQDQLVSIFTQKSKISAAQWEQIRERLVIIHANMTGGDVADRLYELFDYRLLEPHEAQIEKMQASPHGFDPIADFEAFCKEANLTLPKRIARFNQPVLAHLYVGIED